MLNLENGFFVSDNKFHLLNFKILVLMICRGEIKDKAKYLFDAIWSKKKHTLTDTGALMEQGDGGKRIEKYVDIFGNEKERLLEPTIIWSSDILKKSVLMMM